MKILKISSNTRALHEFASIHQDSILDFQQFATMIRLKKYLI